ncbi:sulfite exporter TauE/SafE family protein [Lactiplantibacillus plantarum]|uniref:sulfite exporter TauE/SafE family protein n=1 Tax=Lactiplantibacillus plantarum TaxID=1590 RepID=UPI0007B55EE0|nr:sulfite exporter TauE/SafE family protein [Lactiplantibacillus plantarum]KZU38662.1 Integral membrane protein [Lactiplantibacillus plantarum]
MNMILLGFIGLIIGTFVILFGGGGAAIYLGILTGIFGLKASVAASTSLVTVLPSLVMGTLAYHRQGQINTKVGNQMLMTALPAVVIGSLCSTFIPNWIYKWLIGFILILLGVNMLVQYLSSSHRTESNAGIKKRARLRASLYGILGGLMVGIAGMSGGAVIIAGLFLLGLKAFNATATSTYVIVFMSAVGTLFHIAGGQVDWQAGIPLMIGALIGAIIAPRLSVLLAKTKITAYMKPAIGVFLALLGIKTLL